LRQKYRQFGRAEKDRKTCQGKEIIKGNKKVMKLYSHSG
jgi:hypothetical protein